MKREKTAIETLIAEKGLSTKEFVGKTNITRETIRWWRIKKSKPTLTTVMRIATALNCTMQEVYQCFDEDN